MLDDTGPTAARQAPKRRRDSIAAEEAFRAQLDGLGAVLLEPEWRGLTKKHHVRCVAGHDCYPAPAGARRGQGICLRCVRRDPETAEAEFRAHLAGLGAELLVPYVNSKTPHHVRCAAGHDCYSRPNTLQSTKSGICRVCARNDPVAAEEAFRIRIADIGGIPLYESWRGSGRPHHVRCSNGHDCHPRPNDVQQGDGICRICAGSDTATAENAFLARLQELQATPLYARWLGTKVPHHVRCHDGHDCHPTPGAVRSGQGICRKCANKIWDAFYVVTSDDAVKFGVTSGDARRRIRAHAHAGLTTVTRLVTGLPGTVAPDTERAALKALALSGEAPIRGREYFPRPCLALILDVADSWLAATPDGIV